MAGLYKLFEYNGLIKVRDHKDCHAIIDGSNILHILQASDWLCDFAEYGVQVRNFFEWLANSNITPHVLLDGPNKGDSTKISRTRRRRESRLKQLIDAGSGIAYTEPNSPTGLQDIFRDVARELGIEVLQVVGNRDVTVEIVAYAKHLDALVISANTKFFIQDIPRGCVSINRSHRIDPSRPFRGKTVYYKEFAQRIRLDKSKNPKAPSMWFAIMQAQNVGSEYFDKFKTFFKSWSKTKFTYSSEMLLNLPPNKPHLRLSLHILDFLRQHTAQEAEKIISAQLMGSERQTAILLLQQVCAAHDVPGEDVFGRMNSGFDSIVHFDKDLPQWFLRSLALESKIIPGLMDTVLQQYHFMMVLLEDPSRESANDASLRLRRIIYAILLGSSEAYLDENEACVTEIDRVNNELEDMPVSPLCQLWDPENPSEPLQVPALHDVEACSVAEKMSCFLLSLTVQRSLKAQVGRNSLYLIAVLKCWVNCAAEVTRRDVINVLLTMLLVETRLLKLSGVFVWPVSLRKNVDLTLLDEPKGFVHFRLERMHPFAQLQSTMVFARTLYRMLQEPLGDGADCVWEFISERVFHHLAGRTESEAESGSSEVIAEALDLLLGELLDEKNKAAFAKTVDLIWNADDRFCATQMLDNDAPNAETFD